jgi:hypothetical protein
MQLKLIAGLPAKISVPYQTADICLAFQRMAREIDFHAYSEYNIYLGGEQIGTIDLRDSAKVITILFVDIIKDNRRGAGLGASILKAVLRLAKDIGKDGVLLESTINYGLLQMVYEKINPLAKYSLVGYCHNALLPYRGYNFLWPELDLLPKLPGISARLENVWLGDEVFFQRKDNAWQAPQDKYRLTAESGRLRFFVRKQGEYIFNPAQFHLPDTAFNVAIPVEP